MKRTIAAVLLALAIIGVGYWGAAGWRTANRELTELQNAHKAAQRENETLRQQKTALEQELAALEEQNKDANETLQSWQLWKEALQVELTG